MDTELYNLYNTVRAYRNAITKNLEQIDDNILEIANYKTNDDCKDSSATKYNVALEIVKILENYVKILFLTDNILKEFRWRRACFEDSERKEPACGGSNSNPFSFSAFSFTSPKPIIDAFVVENGAAFDKMASKVASDTETLTNVINQAAGADVPDAETPKKNEEGSKVPPNEVAEESTAEVFQSRRLPTKTRNYRRHSDDIDYEEDESMKKRQHFFNNSENKESEMAVNKVAEEEEVERQRLSNNKSRNVEENFDDTNSEKELKKKSQHFSDSSVDRPPVKFEIKNCRKIMTKPSPFKARSVIKNCQEDTKKSYQPEGGDSYNNRSQGRLRSPSPSQSSKSPVQNQPNSSVTVKHPQQTKSGDAAPVKPPSPTEPLRYTIIKPPVMYNNTPTVIKTPRQPKREIYGRSPIKSPTESKLTTENYDRASPTTASKDTTVKPPQPPPVSVDVDVKPPFAENVNGETTAKVLKTDSISTTDNSRDMTKIKPPTTPPAAPTIDNSSMKVKTEPDHVVEESINHVVENGRRSTPPPSPEPKYTALTKLLSMNVHDRKKEAEKRYDSKYVTKNFNLKVVPRSPSVSPTPGDKKPKERTYILFELADDVLMAGQQCTFSHIESPSEFYVRTNLNLFENLESSLNDDLNSMYQYVVGNYQSKAEAKSMLGRFCFVFLAERYKWFRVEVLDWMETEAERILVQLVDYGDKYFCRYKNLKSMMELYSEFPKMAVKCHFAGLCSPVSENRWPQSSVDALVGLSEMKAATKFEVIYAHKEGDSYSVDLQKEDSDKTLAEILVERKLAVEDELLRRNGLHVIAEEASEEEDDLNFDNLNEAIAGYDAKDEARICPFTDKSGGCFKGPACRLEHGKLSKDGFTTDKVLSANQALNTLELPSVGAKIDIVVTGYVDTCHFYAHIIRNRSKSDLFNDDFERLRENMNSNNVVQTYEPLKVYPGLGELVLVKHGTEWHRASCLQLSGPDNVEVFLVDFGTRLSKKLAEVRKIKEEFLHLPFQAVECLLDTCREKNDVRSEVSWGFFINCMQFKNFKAYVVDANDPLRLNMSDADNIDMAYVLNQCGLIENRNDNMIPKPENGISCA